MPTTKRAPPFRAEHIGSLLRPKELVQKRYDVASGKSKPEELIPLENKMVADVVNLQLECGFKVITSGEYTRHMFWGTFFETLHGMKELQVGGLEGIDKDIFRPYAPDVKAFMEAKEVLNSVTVCVDKIRHPGASSNQREVDLVKSILPKDQWKNIKISLPSPCWYHLRYRAGRSFSKDVYSTDEDYFEDIAKAYREELEILYSLDIRNVQIDDPIITTFCSKDMLDGWAADKTNDKTADEMFEMYLKYYNKCFADRPPDLHVGIHLCRGNYVGSRHFFEGAYDNIAKRLFQNLNVDTYYLEYDTDRAGGFEPLVHLPKDKNVILGVVTSKFPELEDKDKMIDRINQAADWIAKGTSQSREEALQQCGVSPQCGFASHAEGNALGYEDMRKKLQLVRRIADEKSFFNIPVVVDLPGVGTNLQDHYETNVQGKTPLDFLALNGCTVDGSAQDECLTRWENPILGNRGTYASSGLGVTMTYKSSVAEQNNWDVFAFGGPVNFRGYYPGWAYDATSEHNWFTWAILKSHPRNTAGTVNLRSADPLDVPDITYNYFDTGSGDYAKDITAITEAINLACSAFKRQLVPISEVLPGAGVTSAEDTATYIEDNAWGHHASCTCAIGADNDPMAVLDSSFRVRGTARLRVVDASVFPRIPGTFTAVSTYMVAEKAADVILSQINTS